MLFEERFMSFNGSTIALLCYCVGLPRAIQLSWIAVCLVSRHNFLPVLKLWRLPLSGAKEKQKGDKMTGRKRQNKQFHLEVGR